MTLAIHTLDEAAAILRVKPSWLERQAAARKIPFTMLGGSYRFTADHLAAIVALHENRPAPQGSLVPRAAPAQPLRPARRNDLQTSTLRPRPVASRARPPDDNPRENDNGVRGKAREPVACSLARSRWNLDSKPGFRTRKAAEDYGRDQEAAIRNHTYVDPRAGQITLTEWVNQWYPALDLELTTLSNYRYLIEVHILPVFGHRSLASLDTEEIATWEMQLVRNGYSRRTAGDARSMLITVLGDAIPRYLQVNPAERKRGKGRKGLRRIARREKAEKVWATPLQALLVAERCSALSGQDTDFVMILTVAYTGTRWSEVIGLPPECVHINKMDIDWKLYELDGKFYKGAPKDGSMRPADLPPFLSQLLSDHLASAGHLTCNCRNEKQPWCPGTEYVFLGPGQGHFRRSNYSERFFRPAADGWYPGRKGEAHGQPPRCL